MRGNLMYPGCLCASVAFALSSVGAPRFPPLVARFHDDLFICTVVSDHRLLIGAHVLPWPLWFLHTYAPVLSLELPLRLVVI